MDLKRVVPTIEHVPWTIGYVLWSIEHTSYAMDQTACSVDMLAETVSHLHPGAEPADFVEHVWPTHNYVWPSRDYMRAAPVGVAPFSMTRNERTPITFTQQGVRPTARLVLLRSRISIRLSATV